MTTLTNREIDKIHDFLVDNHLPAGLGTKDAACSIASINLALTGTLTDKIPECMSKVIGRWIIRVQDAMPDDMRNGRWKWLLPRAAGTGREPVDEQRRVDILLEWMWGTVLPYVQPVADAGGFGAEWLVMCEQRTANAASAYVAANAASAYVAANAANANANAASAYVAANAAAASAATGAYASAAAATYAYAYANAAAASANAAAYAANDASAYAAAAATAWQHFDPTSILDTLIG